MSKEISDKELDKMIDQSIDQKKKEDKKDSGKPEAKEAKKESRKDDKKPETKKEKEPAMKVEKKKDGLNQSKQAVKPVEGYDAWKILKYPHLAEKSMNMVEMENKLVFVVRRDADKDEIKEAVEKGFGVKVLGVNVVITMAGHKKAYVKIAPEYSASDIATRLGMI